MVEIIEEKATFKEAWIVEEAVTFKEWMETRVKQMVVT
jgi:hypothetical protein